MIWLALTDAISGDFVHINAERIAAMRAVNDQTTVFLAAPGPGGQLLFVVKETPQDIKELIIEAEEELE